MIEMTDSKGKVCERCLAYKDEEILRNMNTMCSLMSTF